jgi:hypothetical protein
MASRWVAGGVMMSTRSGVTESSISAKSVKTLGISYLSATSRPLASVRLHRATISTSAMRFQASYWKWLK